MALKQNKGFIVIEVLISIFIMFLVIVNIVMIYKQVINFNTKNKEYQNLYITTKSIIHLVDTLSLESSSNFYKIKTLDLNGFNVNIYSKLIKQLNSYIPADTENNSPGGHFGDKTFYLYKIKLEISNAKIKKTYQYFLTKMKKRDKK